MTRLTSRQATTLFIGCGIFVFFISIAILGPWIAPDDGPRMAEELKSNYVRAAVLRGLSRGRIVLRHVLRNSLLPAITVIAINVGYVIGGVVVVEFIFSYPGIGNLLLTAIVTRDIPTMLGTMLVVSSGYVFANLVADLLYSLLKDDLTA